MLLRRRRSRHGQGGSTAIAIATAGTGSSLPAPITVPNPAAEGSTVDLTWTPDDVRTYDAVEFFQDGISIVDAGNPDLAAPFELNGVAVSLPSNSFHVVVTPNGEPDETSGTSVVTVTPEAPAAVAPVDAATILYGPTLSASCEVEDADTTENVQFILDLGEAEETVLATDSTPTGVVFGFTWDFTEVLEGAHTFTYRRNLTSAAGGAAVDTTVDITLTYPWTGVASVDAAFVTNPAYVTRSGADVTAVVAQKGAVDCVAVATPQWDADACNGHGAIVFNGTSQYLTADGLAAAVSGTDVAFEVFALVRRTETETAVARQIWAHGNSATANSRHNSGISAAEVINSARTDDAGTSDLDATTETYGNTDWHLVNVQFTGTTVTILVDGAATSVAAAAQNVGLTTLDRLTIMARRLDAGADLFMPGELSAFVRSTAVLSAGNRDAIELCLMSRAGI